MKSAMALRVLGILSFLLIGQSAYAHEAYVTEKSVFWQEIKEPKQVRLLSAWQSPSNIAITLKIALSIIVLYSVNAYLRMTKVGNVIHKGVERLAFLGPIFIRTAIAASFFAAAQSHSLLGPELPLPDTSWGMLMRAVLYLASGLIAFGFLTEVAAVLGLVVFTSAFWLYGSYMFTYLLYVGELVVLLLFGMRRWSVDHALFGPLKRLVKLEKYETTFVRICYGLSLIYTAITIKFLHPEIALRVVNDWNLTQFYWLFPSDPLLVVLGAAIVETLIGIIIIIGFELRLTVLITLFYITMSLIFFREMVWPHYLMYGISLALLVQPEILTADHILFSKHRRQKPWLARIFTPHLQVSKSHHLWRKS